ncbi:uncharacterized protein B0T15DRAFT_154258 [Chaetomium strumarium]|uniref:Uncharacterized protein n=1 Tax=Chaetomium strumarium TaxID=1170767 RepID=A0AAJ0GVG7_9PEZI|nr:hypothetical protein B0T15DRAFT_154258 [Chaetomium strumarium]
MAVTRQLWCCLDASLWLVVTESVSACSAVVRIGALGLFNWQKTGKPDVSVVEYPTQRLACCGMLISPFRDVVRPRSSAPLACRPHQKLYWVLEVLLVCYFMGLDHFLWDRVMRLKVVLAVTPSVFILVLLWRVCSELCLIPPAFILFLQPAELARSQCSTVDTGDYKSWSRRVVRDHASLVDLYPGRGVACAGFPCIMVLD